ncbi:MAG TPA: hypothetical protein VGR09_06985, partial [Gemmatimonadales bacterium]|nr:hypothetical protein [Gemmatimonadales bacterium]
SGCRRPQSLVVESRHRPDRQVVAAAAGIEYGARGCAVGARETADEDVIQSGIPSCMGNRPGPK